MSFQMMRINFIWIFLWNIYERSLDHSRSKLTQKLSPLVRFDWEVALEEARLASQPVRLAVNDKRVFSAGFILIRLLQHKSINAYVIYFWAMYMQRFCLFLCVCMSAD